MHTLSDNKFIPKDYQNHSTAKVTTTQQYLWKEVCSKMLYLILMTALLLILDAKDSCFQIINVINLLIFGESLSSSYLYFNKS
jgi:hypothetical protein